MISIITPFLLFYLPPICPWICFVHLHILAQNAPHIAVSASDFTPRYPSSLWFVFSLAAVVTIATINILCIISTNCMYRANFSFIFFFLFSNHFHWQFFFLSSLFKRISITHFIACCSFHSFSSVLFIIVSFKGMLHASDFQVYYFSPVFVLFHNDGIGAVIWSNSFVIVLALSEITLMLEKTWNSQLGLREYFLLIACSLLFFEQFLKVETFFNSRGPHSWYLTVSELFDHFYWWSSLTGNSLE